MLSIIVPVYNSETYLTSCLDSLLAQDITNYEIILVDDGSKDNSGQICDEYEKKYPDLIKVIHKNNGGAASARNVGMAVAKGEIIGFVDSDDVIAPDMYKVMTKTMHSTQCDVVETFFIKKGQKILFKNTWERPITGREALHEMFLWNLTTSLCTKLFRKEIFDGLLMEEGHTNEDFRFLCEIFLRPIKVQIIPQAFYKYRETPNSVTRQLRPSFFDIFRNVDYISSILPSSDSSLNKDLNRYAFTMHIMSGIKIIRNKSKKIYTDWLKVNRRFVWKHLKKYLFDQNLSIRWKLKGLYILLH